MSNLREIETKYWQSYLSTLAEEDRPLRPRVVAFHAGGRAITDSLLQLYLAGKKSAGSSIVEDFLSAGDPLPEVGNYWILLDSRDQPSLILRTERVVVHQFNDVPPEVAVAEGEGDLSIEYWRRAHRELYEASLKDWGVNSIDEATVITEFFRIVFKE